jgi:hypothetical protein
MEKIMIGSTSDFITPWVWGLFGSFGLIVLVSLLIFAAFLGLGMALEYIFSPRNR